MSPTAADILGTQPVHQAAVTGKEKALWFLVRDLNVDVNQGATAIQLTALHYAAKVRSLGKFWASLTTLVCAVVCT